MSRGLERELAELRESFMILRDALGESITRQQKMEREIRELREAVSEVDRRQADCIGVNDSLDVIIYLDTLTGKRTVQFRKVQ